MKKRKSTEKGELAQAYEIVAIDAVQPHPRNPRRGDVVAIGESIDRVGFYGAIIVQRSTGFILAGNHRWMAAKSAGRPDIPVIFVDVDDEMAARIMVADNRTSDRAAYDDADLLVLLSSLDGDLAGTGFDVHDLDHLLKELSVVPGENASGSGDVGLTRSPSLTMMVSAGDVGLLERAILKTGLLNRAKAVRVILEAFVGQG